MTAPDGTSSSADRLPLSNILLVLLLGVVWGVNWPAIRVSVLEIEPWTFRTICLGAGASMLVAVAVARGTSLRVPLDEIGQLGNHQRSLKQSGALKKRFCASAAWVNNITP